MEEASTSHSSSDLSLQVTLLPSADKANAVDCDQSCFEAEVSAPLFPTENPGNLAVLVLSSKENADFVAGNLSPGVQSQEFAEIEVNSCCEFAETEVNSCCESVDAVNSCSLKSMSGCETICAALCDAMQENKESSSSDVLEMRSIQKGDCSLVIREGDCLFGAANGKPKESSGSVVPELRAILKEVTGFKVLGAAPGKLSERVDAVRDDFPCSLEIELIDDTAVIGIEMDTAGKRNVKKEQPKKDRKPRRRPRAAKTDSDENKNCTNLKVSTVISTRNKRTEKPKKIAYSRKAMETLRYWNLKGQRKLWHRIYNVFSSTMKTEYEEMGCSRDQNKQSGLIWDTNRAPPVLGMAATKGGFSNDYARQENFSEFLWGRRNFV